MTFNTFYHFAFLWLLSIVLSGCLFLPHYEAAEGAATATIESIHKYNTELCINGEKFTASDLLEKHPFIIPANERITIINRVTITGGHITYRCNSGISFIPEPGENYVTDVLLSSTRCRSELAKRDDASPTHLSPVASIDASQIDCPL